MKFTFTRNNTESYTILDRGTEGLLEEYKLKGRNVEGLSEEHMFRVAVITDTAYHCPVRGIIYFSKEELEEVCNNFRKGFPNTGVAMYAGHKTLVDGGGREALGWCFEDHDGMYVAEITYNRGNRVVTENAIIAEGYWNNKGVQAYKDRAYRFTSVEISLNSKDKELGNLADAVNENQISVDENGSIVNNKHVGKLITGIALTNEPMFYLPEIQSQSEEYKNAEITVDNIVAFRDIVGQPNGDIVFYNSQGQKISITEENGKPIIKKDMVVNYTAMSYDYTEESTMVKTKKVNKVLGDEIEKPDELSLEENAQPKGEEDKPCEECKGEGCESCEAPEQASEEQAPEEPAEKQEEAPKEDTLDLSVVAAFQKEKEELLLSMKAQLETAQLELSRVRDEAELQKLQLKEELKNQQEALAAMNRQLAEKSRESYIARVNNATAAFSEKGLPEAAVKSIRNLLIEASLEVRENQFNFSNEATGAKRTLDIFGLVESIVNSFDSSMFKSADPIENEAPDSDKVVTDKLKKNKNPLL